MLKQNKAKHVLFMVKETVAEIFSQILVLNHFPEYYFQKPCGFLKKI